MTWITLTTPDNEKRLVNMSRYVTVKPDDDGSYLICSDASQSMKVKESLHVIRSLMTKKPD